MIITCEQCQARFRLADEKLKPGGIKVRCSKCKHIFTILPPESNAVEEFAQPGEGAVAEETSAPATAAEGASPDEPGGAGAFEFGGRDEQPDAGTAGEGAGEFAFAGGATPAQEPPQEAPGTDGPAEFDFGSAFAEAGEAVDTAAGPGESGEFSFNEPATAEPAIVPPQAEPEAPAGEFDAFSFEETPAAAPATASGETGEFSFEEEPATPAAAEPAFGAEPAEAGLSEFGFETAEPPAVVGKTADTFEFGSDDGFESTAFGQETPPGVSGATPWEQPAQESGPSFDFDEPSFDTQAAARTPESRDESGMSFGEIDFSDDEGETAPVFAEEPDFREAAKAPPSGETPPPPPVAPPPRPAESRPRNTEPPAPVKPARSPLSRLLPVLLLLLLALCGAAGYFYFMGGGDQVVDRLILKLKGEEPVAPLEQRIGLNISGSSYVDNREAGQLLVIQGEAANNFAGARSSITVKGLLLNAGGKVLQQQTVFCGNYLSEEKLAGMTYAQIEEAMNNQFGDSLSNMNLKPGGKIRFTIVFRNPPQDLANINVEVVDSKPGGL